MPRYLVERHLAAGVGAALSDDAMPRIVAANRYAEVAWLHSYVTEDATVMLCLYEADTPEAIRKAARRAGLPVTVIHRVTVLDPHGYAAPGQANSHSRIEPSVPPSPSAVRSL